MMKRKAISLLSGGLDSALATRLILDQGIDVLGVHLSGPFGCHEDVEAVAKSLGIPLKVVDKGSAYLDLVRNPKYGYGKNMNPCIDCRIYMFQLAHSVMEEVGADFIITGEVVGQRPMSQRREAFKIIDRDSQMEELILRPLSAKNLEPTRPEKEGWVNREALLNISGRGRGEQLALAKEWNISGYSSPAGGCLLTDPNFSEKLELFFKTRSEPTVIETSLLRYGRFFDLGPETFVLIGRNKEDNERLETLSRDEVLAGRLVFFNPVFTGPVAVLSGDQSQATLNEVVRLIVRYSKREVGSEKQIEVSIKGELISFSIPEEIELPVVHA